MIDKEKATKIIITFPNGREQDFCLDEFEDFGRFSEHKERNIAIDTAHLENSYVYETDSHDEIVNKDYLLEVDFV